MSLYEDFRASVRADTAERRLEHFKSLLGTINAAYDLAELHGDERPRYGEAPYAYRRLVEAHVDFAKAQLLAAAAPAEPVAEAGTDAESYGAAQIRALSDVLKNQTGDAGGRPSDAPLSSETLRLDCLKLAVAMNYRGYDPLAVADRLVEYVRKGRCRPDRSRTGCEAGAADPADAGAAAV